MDRWKSDNYETGGERLTSRASLSRRLIGLAGVAALTVGGAGAVLLGAGSAYAATAAGSYIIGASTGVPTVALSTNTSGNVATYTVNFTSPGALAAGTGTLTVSLLNNGVASTAALGTGYLIDSTQGWSESIGAVTSGTAITLPNTAPNNNSVTAGDSLSLQIAGVTNGAAGSLYQIGITTSASAQSLSADFAIAAGVTTTPSVTPSSYLPGAVNVTDTLANFAVTAGTVAPAVGTGVISNTNGLTFTVNGGSLPTSAAQYTLKDQTTGVTIPVTTSPASGGTLTENLTWTTSYAVSVGDLLSLSVTGVQNAATSGNYTFALDQKGATTSTPVTVTFGSSVSAVTVTPSSSIVSAVTEYSVSFTATSALAAGTGTVTLAEATGPTTFSTLPASYVVLDNTTGASGTVTVVPTTAAGTVTVTTPLAISAGDKVTLEAFNVTNPAAAQTIADFTVNTSTDAAVVTAPQYSIGAAPGTGTTSVTVSPATAGSTASYLIQGLQVTTGGISAGTNIVFTFSPTTAGTFPTSAGAYKITDLTNSAFSETPTTATYASGVVTLTLSNSLPSGDSVSVSISGVINPSAGSYSVSASANLVAPSAAAATTPTAAVTYSNGALVQAGSQIDVIAGGYAFGIPSFSTYQTIAGMLGTTVVSGSFPTATAPRAGTLIQPVGSAGVWVVGTNGMIYQFSSASQLTSDGYSFMNVIPVPSAAGLTAGTGVPPTAAVTTPDGALVQYGSTIYVYAGGTPFGIPTFANYQTIAAATGTMVVQGSGTTPVASATTANGVLVQPIGTAGIWVTYNGALYPFSTPAQLTSDGYSFNYVVPVPTTGSLTIA